MPCKGILGGLHLLDLWSDRSFGKENELHHVNSRASRWILTAARGGVVVVVATLVLALRFGYLRRDMKKWGR